MTQPKVGTEKTKLLFFFVAGALALLVVILGYHLLTSAFAMQTKVACHTPKSTNTEYCVYHTQTPRLLADKNTLLIGPSSGRGIVYDVPYSLNEIVVTWDAADAATIAMPSTRLIIESEEYIDTR